MAGRPKQEKADIEKMVKVNESLSQVIDPRPVIALTMRYCGCTFQEIADVFKVTRQMAETIFKNAERDL